ncbi:outer membrane beta-barrel protein [Dinghuibacter silviterrae]|uniref:Putative OmpL-like beta-barrel porin-2 n=1 Tax=Dinghuibacter silviterrae TaxID=1539049 RepID=A0A4R8DY23_9BACT|nr:outer membrane beta-barrel protein [Dinghuibacter silviterrae]TDX02111.1 putative OmpL-like beta-barrel porin-2 [Dinghuibacter silviterrae]
MTPKRLLLAIALLMAASPCFSQTFDSTRVLPSPLPSPPFPASDWQYGEPLIGLPEDAPDGPLQRALGLANDPSRIKIYGWVVPGFNLSSSRETNVPVTYNTIPNSAELDQLVLRIEREPNTVQTRHFDWGFRLSNVFGQDYRYTVSKGWFSKGYFTYNHLYGYDPVETYVLLYFPKVWKGMILKIGRYISPPDIEAQLATNNYLYTHSVMFTYDAFTFTGVQATVKVSKRIQFILGVHGGSDVAAWDSSASWHGQAMLRWVSADNNDGLWGGINTLGQSNFKKGHDNKQAIALTWGHRFNKTFHIQTEAYYQWQYNGALGGSASYGPVRYGAGGGPGAIVHGINQQIGFVNFSQMLLSSKSFLCLRNDLFSDVQGQLSGFATTYFSHTFGVNYFFTDWLQIRPEVRYDWNSDPSLRPYDATGNNPKTHQFLFSMDMIVRY